MVKNSNLLGGGSDSGNGPLQRDEAIFDVALHHTDPERRAAYLERVCAGRPGLRERIDALLRAHEDAEVFFEHDALVAHATTVVRPLRQKGASSSGQTEDEELPADTRIGRYRLLECIGRGGCGVVYLARQEEPIKRQVALKIIRRGTETRGVIARFEAERQALAMMDHPCIARVFDASTTEWGAPYFVMEHVRGVRITEFCDQHRLTIRERLDLFVRICHAIQHAHQKGIIHGDIKPSNIIVTQHDNEATPKVIDFGISRATEARRGADKVKVPLPLAGTPAYMSPEELEAAGTDTDTRSDIYSLGTLLYELLIGRTPVDSEELLKVDWPTLQEMLCRRPHPPLSQRFSRLGMAEQTEVARRRQLTPAKLLKILRGDLEWIIAKTLQKDRQHRYETANALAMEIGRYVHTEPVLAHPGSWFYRIGKLARRNRAGFIATGAVALALICGLGLSTWLFLKERDARERAVAAEQQQARLRLEAETREKITQAALLVSHERYAEADNILADVHVEKATVEGAAVFRAVGEWHALHDRWREAVDRFQVLLRINQLDGADVTSLDYLELGPALIEFGDRAGYDRFRQEAIARFMKGSHLFSDRIVKISLLTPANDPLLQALEPLAAETELFCEKAISLGDDFQAAWRSMSLALYEYRRGNYSRALNWSQRCLADVDANYPRSAAAYAIVALANYQMGRLAEAHEASHNARRLFDAHSPMTDRGTPVQGFWFDWALTRILVREAESTLP